ncbi:T9SS type A sorting domain-containing protein [Flavobacterium sp.]|uniref:T9SS type A sorting domain-containing protein n=1 Tax=Flavobacterium sp. TaxID=239 RepID=UPI002B4AD836|nr:T9SS type A sorting domain-containing protein [Flavobacterium sp.]HLF51331.1 T9SS type A sorting domain-containing protein [Flavobacterium sp.]
MKKIYIGLLIAGMINLSFAQTKSSGVITFASITSMSVKLDVNKTTSKVTMTLTGPADRLFCIGFGSTSMNGITDSFTSNSPTTILDSNGFTGYSSIIADSQQNWTLVSNVVDGTGLIRTLVATRALNTGDVSDYTFDYDNLTSLNISWAMWRTANEWALNGKDLNGAGTVNTRHNNAASLTRGGVVATFYVNEMKSTGVVSFTSITPMSVKLDMDNTASQLTMTLTGPADRLFCIGFGNTIMDGADTVTNNSPTSIMDTQPFIAHSILVADTQQDWTLVSNVVDGTGLIRTLIATRALNTGDATDYTFNYATLTNLNIIWGMWRTANEYALNGKDLNGAGTVTTRHNNAASLTRGTAQLTFGTLGVDNFASLDKINVYPNPSNGFLNISKNNDTSISKIRVFDTNAKLLKEIDSDVNSELVSINISNLSRGMYFVEISNEQDKVVKKIIIK